MGFCFKRKETVPDGIRRLGGEQIEDALDCLKDCGRVEAIHCARKDIKRVRAVLRLVCTQIPKKEFRRLTRLLRETASHLAGPRDAYVKAETLRNLVSHFKGQLAPGALRHIRAELRATADEELRRFGKEHTARTVQKMLRRLARDLEDLDVSGNGWKALAPGIKAAYSRGQSAYQTVLKDPAPENFHEWRKRAKDLWYQVSLLHPTWPEQLDAMTSELDKLSECLGDDHDLVVLRQAAEEHLTGDASARELEALCGLIEQRQRELRSAALGLGARFYAEKPAQFCDRLAGYWQIWCREKKSRRSRLPIGGTAD